MSKTQSKVGVTIADPCDCSMNLLKAPDGGQISTNCPTAVTDTIVWQAITNVLPNGADWDESDWVNFVDAGNNLFYDNGLTDSLLRIKYTEKGCTKYSNVINTGSDCSCDCWSNIIYDTDDTGDLILYTEGCTFSIITWQFFTGGVWTNVQTGGASYNWTTPGKYRAKITKTNCCDTYSNIEITYNI